MTGNAFSFVSVVAFFDDEIWRRLAGAMIVRRFLQCFSAGLQSVEKLAEVVSSDLDAIIFLHGLADIPGQVGQIRQVFSGFFFRNDSDNLAAWQKLRQ